MLKNIHPLLNADLLHVLRSMGHGDEIALVGRNFPSTSVAGTKPVIKIDGASIPEVGKAILSVLPLDSFVDKPVRRMEVVGEDVSVIPPIQLEFQALIDEEEGKSSPMGSLERFAFYEQARQSFAIVSTGESRAYGCFLLKKGVIFGE